LHHSPWGRGREGDTRVCGVSIGRTRIIIARQLSVSSLRLTQAITTV
jgi:hypothetical protein